MYSTFSHSTADALFAFAVFHFHTDLSQIVNCTIEVIRTDGWIWHAEQVETDKKEVSFSLMLQDGLSLSACAFILSFFFNEELL